MSAKPDVFMPVFLGDLHKHIQRLNRADFGSYMFLMMDYWIMGPPPDDDETLRTIAKCSEHDWSMARARLLQFFDIIDGRWVQKRVEEELTKATNRKVKAKQAADARWEAERARQQAELDARSMPQASAKRARKQCSSPSPSQVDIEAPHRASIINRRDAPVSPLGGDPAPSPREGVPQEDRDRQAAEARKSLGIRPKGRRTG